MRVVLLSGGSGTRLWPISTEFCPKQFVSFFKDNESMLESTYKNVKKLFSSIYIATQYDYVKIIKEQIKENVNFIIEPSKIGTFAAILNIAAYFKYVECLFDEEVISVIPTDHDVNSDFYKTLNTSSLHLKASNNNICLIGIKPSFPSSQYGYIIHKDNIVKKFQEKPNTAIAKKLISENALWNSGILVFKLKSIIDISKKYFAYSNYEEFIKLYDTLPKNSFDREVLEKIKDIGIIETNNNWNDLGTWETLSEKISVPDQYNTNIINLEDKEIRNNGVKNAIIVNCENGISLINKNTDRIYWKNWGYYKVIDNYNTKVNNIKIKLLHVIKGNNISYQYHKFRSETWYILNGCGEAIIDKKIINIKPGDVLNISKEQLHSICATEDIQIVEVQYGLKNLESDVVRIEKDWLKILALIKGK